MIVRLIIFAVIMLALSGLCNGQGKTSFGAGRAQDTSFTIGQLRLPAYAGSADTTIAIFLPNGTVKKVAKDRFGTDTTSLSNRIDGKQDTLGFTPPYVYNVIDYGATPNDSTDDDGPAIMAAIADMFGITITYNATRDTVTWVRNPGERIIEYPIYFPNGYYHVSSPLVRSINGKPANCQLFIPTVTYNTDSITEVTVKFLGPTEASILESNYADVKSSYARNGAQVKSTLMYDGSAFPAILGVERGDSSILNTFPGNQQVVFQNMWFRTEYGAGGAQLCGVDVAYALDLEWINSRVDYDTSGFVAPLTTNDVFGVRGPAPFTGTVASYRSGLVVGFKDGIVSGEHTHIHPEMQIFMCENAINQLVCGHFAYYEWPTIQWCKTLIKTGGYGVQSGMPVVAGANIAYILGGIKAEKFCGGTYATGIDIVDSANILSGNIKFMALRAGCFPTIYQQVPTRINATRLTVETPVEDQSINHRNFGMYYTGGDSTRWGVTYQNINPIGQTNIFLTNSRGTSGMRGFIGLCGPTSTSTVAGLSLADRLTIMSDGSSNLGLLLGTNTNDPVDFMQNGTIRGTINTSGNWVFSSSITVNTTGVADPLMLSSDINGRGGIVVRNTNTGVSAGSTFYFDVSAAFTNYGGLAKFGASATGTFFGMNRASATFLIDDGTANTGLGIGTITNDPVVIGTSNTARITVAGDGKITISGLSTYADNTAALAGGLTAGMLYRTSTGQLMIVF